MDQLGHFYLPNGNQTTAPMVPRTWSENKPVLAATLENEAGTTIGFHRDLPLFEATANTTQSIPNNAWTAVTTWTPLTDNCSGLDTGSDFSRYYPPATSGSDWFLVIGYIPWNSSATAAVFVTGVQAAGNGVVYEGGIQPSGAGHPTTTMVVDLVQKQSPRYFQLMGWQNTGVAVSTVVAGKSPSFMVRWATTDQGVSGITTPATPALLHTWVDADEVTADATGSSSAVGGVKVPLNRELRDAAMFLTNRPALRVSTQGTTQTIPAGAGTWTPLTWMVENLDNYGMWGSGNTVTCQRAGLYFVAGTAAVIESTAKTGYRAVRIRQGIAAGGSATFGGGSCQPSTGTVTNGTSLIAVAMIRMAVGDTLQLQFDHTNGSALSVKPGLGPAAKLIALYVSA